MKEKVIWELFLGQVPDRGISGARVTCSDVCGPTQQAKRLHKKYKVEKRMEYKEIDATNISDEYSEKFDIITFKSVLGGIRRLGNGKQQEMSSSWGIGDFCR